MWAAVANLSHLAVLATSAKDAGRDCEILPDGVDGSQSFKNIPRQADRPNHMLQLALFDQIGRPGSEGERPSAYVNLPAKAASSSNVETIIDFSEQFVKRVASGLHVHVCHTNDGFVLKALGSSVACGL